MSASVGELLTPVYYASDPNTYVVITGAGVKGMKVKKSGWKHMFQNATKVDVSPQGLDIDIQVMSKEKLPFRLPGSFTVGVKLNNNEEEDHENIRKYAQFMGKTAEQRNGVLHMIKGVIEGEVRALTANLEMEKIFSDREAFNTQIIEKLSEQLEKFGMTVYNANIKELSDTGDSNFFKNNRQKILAEAENKAKIDVAVAVFNGESQSKSTERDTKLTLAKIATETAKGEKEQEVNRKTYLAEREAEAVISLAKISTDTSKGEKLQDIEKRTYIAEKDGEINITLSKIGTDTAKQQKEQEVEKRTYLAQKESEALSCENKQQEIIITSNANLDLSKTENNKRINLAKIHASKDVDLQTLELDERNNKKMRDVNLSKMEATVLTDAEVLSKKIHIESDARLYQMTQEAQGLSHIVSAFKEPQLALFYLLSQNGLLEKLAQTNSDAIKGLNPQITVWNTGSSSESDPMSSIRNIFQAVPPLFSTIHQQTGMQILPQLASQPSLSNTK